MTLNRRVVDTDDDQRHARVHPERGGVVDHHGAGGSECRGKGSGTVPPGREQRDVDTGRVGGRQVLDLDLAPLGLDLAPGGPLRRQQPKRPKRKVPLLEDGAHGAAHGPGGPYHGDDAVTHAPTSSKIVGGSNAEWSARTASSTSSALTTHDIRIVEVEIISMFIPASDSVWNTFAATPG